MSAPKAKKVARSSKRQHPLGDLGGTYFDHNGIPRFILPKVLKSDPRRMYSEMFQRVFNSCDMDTMRSFLKEFSLPNVLIRTTSLGQHSANDADLTIDDALVIWGGLVAASPDVLLSTRDAQLRVRSNQTATVHMSFSMTGTVFLEQRYPVASVPHDAAPLDLDLDADLDADLERTIDSLMDDATTSSEATSLASGTEFAIDDLSQQLNSKMVLRHSDLHASYRSKLRQAHGTRLPLTKSNSLLAPHRTVAVSLDGHMDLHLDELNRVWMVQWRMA